MTIKTRFNLPSFILCFLLISLSNLKLIAQNEPLSETFQFTDGVYLSFEEFRGNNPTYLGEDVELFYIDSLDYHLKHVSKIKINGKKIGTKKVWGICFKGIPYVNYLGGMFEAGSNKDILGGKKIVFSKIDIIGSLCVFNLEGSENNYNTNSFTINGSHNKHRYNVNKILDIYTGKVYPYEYFVVEHFVKNDEQLYKELLEHRLEINLMDFIIAYNRKHLIYPAPVSLFYPKEEK